MQERPPLSNNTATVFPGLRAAAAELLKAHPEVVFVDEAAVDRLTGSLSAQEVTSKAERVGLPLKFGNALEVRACTCARA